MNLVTYDLVGSDSEVNDAEEDQYYVIQSCDSNDKYLKG